MAPEVDEEVVARTDCRTMSTAAGIDVGVDVVRLAVRDAVAVEAGLLFRRGWIGHECPARLVPLTSADAETTTETARAVVDLRI